MKIDPNAPAFPCATDRVIVDPAGQRIVPELRGGMTIRAVIAKDMMAAQVSSPTPGALPEDYARSSVMLADAMIAELNKAEGGAA